MEAQTHRPLSLYRRGEKVMVEFLNASPKSVWFHIKNIATRWDPYDSYPHDSDLFILFEVCNNSLKGSSYIIYPIFYTLIY